MLACGMIWTIGCLLDAAGSRADNQTNGSDSSGEDREPNERISLADGSPESNGTDGTPASGDDTQGSSTPAGTNHQPGTAEDPNASGAAPSDSSAGNVQGVDNGLTQTNLWTAKQGTKLPSKSAPTKTAPIQKLPAVTKSISISR